MDECAGMLALQCCLGTSCTPGTTKSAKKPSGERGNCTPSWLLSYTYASGYSCLHTMQD